MNTIVRLEDRRAAVWHPAGEYWHRYSDDDRSQTRCGLENYEAVPTARLADTNPEDRCRTCWPTTKETQ